MDKIYIWGIGRALTFVKENINWKQVELLGYIDNAKKNQGKLIDGIKVYSPEEKLEKFDYIVISVFENFADIKKQLLECGVDENKILSYYDMDDFNFDSEIRFISSVKRMNHIFERKYLGLLNNLEFEIADKIQKGAYQFPIIKSAKEGLRRVIEEKMSLCRFGDGELEIACAREKCPYQNYDPRLGARLREVLVNQETQKVVTGLSQYYGELDMYQKKYADELRVYFTKEKRQRYLEILDLGKVYYDALMSRPYMMRQDEEYAREMFLLWKSLWEKRDIVIVEGELTRSGYGNDLYDNANSMKRILCPAENAWDYYNEIYQYIKENIKKENLILIALGPAATVLSYDLAIEGYQAIDLGHLDIEYEWYLRKAKDRMDISYKYVGEMSVNGRKAVEIDDGDYAGQIIQKIGI